MGAGEAGGSNGAGEKGSGEEGVGKSAGGAESGDGDEGGEGGSGHSSTTLDKPPMPKFRLVSMQQPTVNVTTISVLFSNSSSTLRRCW